MIDGKMIDGRLYVDAEQVLDSIWDVASLTTQIAEDTKQPGLAAQALGIIGFGKGFETVVQKLRAALDTA